MIFSQHTPHQVNSTAVILRLCCLYDSIWLFCFEPLFSKIALRLILMRIRLSFSDLGQVAKVNLFRAKSKQASCAEMVLGSFIFCSCDSAVRFSESEDSSQRRLLLRPAPRRAHFARPCTQASKPTLTDSSLDAKRRAEALHVVFFQRSIRAQHDEPYDT